MIQLGKRLCFVALRRCDLECREPLHPPLARQVNATKRAFAELREKIELVDEMIQLIEMHRVASKQGGRLRPIGTQSAGSIGGVRASAGLRNRIRPNGLTTGPRQPQTPF